MLRIVFSIVAIPMLLTALLAGAMEMSDGRLGSVTLETFELGLLPIVLLAALVLCVIFLPLLLLASKLVGVSWWSAAVAGLLSVVLPTLIGSWSFLTDASLRLNYRLERFGDHYPWLALGVVGGLLFWLLAVFRNRALDKATFQESR